MNWLVKKTGPPAKSLASVDEVKNFIDGSNVAIVGFFADQETPAAKNFLNVASAIDDQVFGIVSDASIFPEFKAEDSKIVMFKKV